MQVEEELAHYFPVDPDNGKGLAHSHWHANHRNEQIGDGQINDKVICHAVTLKNNNNNNKCLMSTFGCLNLDQTMIARHFCVNFL